MALQPVGSAGGSPEPKTAHRASPMGWPERTPGELAGLVVDKPEERISDLFERLSPSPDTPPTSRWLFTAAALCRIPDVGGRGAVS